MSLKLIVGATGWVGFMFTLVTYYNNYDRYVTFRDLQVQRLLSTSANTQQTKGKNSSLSLFHLTVVPLFLSFSNGEEVYVEIDSVRRRHNARIHSAGHLLDSALINLGMTDLIPSKVCFRDG